jgi:nucleoside-diphosphate-sugar epimerase
MEAEFRSPVGDAPEIAPEVAVVRPIVVTGASGAVGRRVCAVLSTEPGISVIAIDRKPLAVLPPAVVMQPLDLATADLKPIFEGAAAVVHLASSFDPQEDDLAAARADLECTKQVLDAAGAVGVAHIVLLSSAMVYGAWPGSPVPLTEEAPLRPNPEFPFAVYKAEVERLAMEWRNAHPSTTMTVLRPATTLADGEVSWVARTLRAAAVMDVGETDPPVQFLHTDDLAQAVVLGATNAVAGTFNVSPDGWLDGESQRELAGRVPRLRLNEQVARRVAGFGWRHRLAHTPPGIVPYTMHPWVIASDKLRAAGWVPTHSNEEAYVVGTPARPWAAMNAKRRQQIALGAAVVLGLGAGGLGLWLWRRFAR